MISLKLEFLESIFTKKKKKNSIFIRYIKLLIRIQLENKY